MFFIQKKINLRETFGITEGRELENGLQNLRNGLGSQN